MARRSKDNAIDWDSIELEYRNGEKSNKQLAKEYGVQPSSIGRRAERHGWTTSRPRAGVPIPQACVKAEKLPAGFVYVIEMQAGGVRYCKIGMSANFGLRLDQHQSSCPFELTVACCYFVGDMRAEERELHQMLAAKRVRGEWFALSQADLEMIARRSLLL